MLSKLRYLLLQVRNSDDPMREQEVRCFARALDCDASQISVFDLISGVPSKPQLDRVDVVLLGGSGNYSVAEGGPWLPAALEAMQELVDFRKPTFASCWGFQAMARALGGEVVTDLARAEVGTHVLHLTEAGKRDPVFGPLGDSFDGQMGHHDIVVKLPPGAVLLASSGLVENQAFRLADEPIYCTQFHPELNRRELVERVRHYPQYVQRITGLPMEKFLKTSAAETPAANRLLRRFVAAAFG